MRYIDTSNLTASLPPNWEDKTTAALDAARTIASDDSLSCEEKRKAISQSLAKPKYGSKSPWSRIKEDLKQMSGGTCWYCESRLRGSYGAVDHFRPKNGVHGNAEHLGYWWLAFSPRNFRFSCDLFNTSGKGTLFPLCNEESRCYCEGDPLPGEQPMLLDPVKRGDPELLEFLPNGEVVPAHRVGIDSRQRERAEVTIEVLLLRHPDRVEGRLDVWETIKKRIRDGVFFLAQMGSGDNQAEERFRELVEELVAMVKPGAEFSATARAALVTEANEVDWLAPIL